MKSSRYCIRACCQSNPKASHLSSRQRKPACSHQIYLDVMILTIGAVGSYCIYLRVVMAARHGPRIIPPALQPLIPRRMLPCSKRSKALVKRPIPSIGAPRNRRVKQGLSGCALSLDYKCRLTSMVVTYDGYAGILEDWNGQGPSSYIAHHSPDFCNPKLITRRHPDERVLVTLQSSTVHPIEQLPQWVVALLKATNRPCLRLRLRSNMFAPLLLRSIDLGRLVTATNQLQWLSIPLQDPTVFGSFHRSSVPVNVVHLLPRIRTATPGQPILGGESCGLFILVRTPRADFRATDGVAVLPCSN